VFGHETRNWDRRVYPRRQRSELGRRAPLHHARSRAGARRQLHHRRQGDEGNGRRQADRRGQAPAVGRGPDRRAAREAGDHPEGDGPPRSIKSSRMARKQTPPVADTPLLDASSEYTVVARRYRPQQFKELIGQESVALALTNAIQSGRVAHAYLFTGARGVGKTSAARILAKCLNCVTGPTVTPCDKCDICRAIADGQDVDVIEIDGASNTSVDDVRLIRNNVATRPQRARYKIYIIDEVHMLSKSAFNALLKTLEEPPPHVKFIFATTEVQKIPITILSRCQRFDFGGINTSRILAQLKQVVAGEGMAADDEALRIIARRAGGSMRDAQSLLEQLLSFDSKRLTADIVHSVLGT